MLRAVLVEKILSVQPDVKKLYLLVRAPDAASAEQRILSQVSRNRVTGFDKQSSSHACMLVCRLLGCSFSRPVLISRAQVLGKDLFNTLRDKHGLAGFQKLIKEKIVPLAGDVGTRDFGLHGSRLEDLCEEIDIIIHGAATTSFYERYNNCTMLNGNTRTSISGFTF